jgi:uncharacterized protein YkwD
VNRMAKISHLLRDLQFLAYFLVALTTTGCSSVEFADKVSQANPLDEFEQDLVNKLNELRQGVGAPTLAVCASLNIATSAHSDDMRDNNFLSDVAPDKSTTPIRACEAGFQPACLGIPAMIEFIANGHGEGSVTLEQWKKDAQSSVELVRPEFVVVGVGRALGGEKPIWTMDLADRTDASCGE